MEVVRGGDVDDLDAVVGQEVVKGRVGMSDAEGVGPCRATFRGTAQHAAHVHADPPQSLHVDGPDEPGPDDGGTDIGDGHPAPRSDRRWRRSPKGANRAASWGTRDAVRSWRGV